MLCLDNRVLLVAAAGSGKTSTMVAKAGHVLRRGYVAPDRMLLLAFNNDAASELRERLPSLKTVNVAKSDRLPEAELMTAQRPLFEENWTRLRDASPVAFHRQASTLVDRLAGPFWASTLFGKIREAVELTAVQRGVVRWRPADGHPL